ncbi:MAG: efflux transporter outer membrane subunit [Bdellovibrionales bacterium]
MRFSLLAAPLSFMIIGCAVGPDFVRPTAPSASSYDSEKLPDQIGALGSPNGATQTFVHGRDIPAEWWTLFRSPALNKLLELALANNPDLQAAEAALRAAQENSAAGGGSFYPSLSASYSSSRQQTAAAASGGMAPSSTYSLHNASVGVSFVPDVFGGTRRTVEALDAQRDARKFQMDAAWLAISANVVTAAIHEASLRGQIEAIRAIIADEEKQLEVAKQQFDLGAVDRTAVLAQEATLAQTRTSLPALDRQLAQVRHALSALTGRLPNEAPGASFELASLTLPTELPVSLPSSLVEQRPDIRAAEASLHAASAAIGVATANRLPQITLSADVGTSANTLANLFGAGTGFWSLGAGLAQKIFDAGSLEHRQRAAEAEYDAAAAMYRKTVLTAFQNVADTLRALQSDAVALQASSASERVATDNLNLTREKFKAGAVSYLALLDAQRLQQQSKVALVQAQAQRFADTAALFQALGGGWWNKGRSLPQSAAQPVLGTPEPAVPAFHSKTLSPSQTRARKQ